MKQKTKEQINQLAEECELECEKEARLINTDNTGRFSK